MTAKKEKEEKIKEARILILVDSEGEKRITLPAGARITFAPNVPGGRGKNNYGEIRPEGYSIRVYETKTNDSLCAVFTNVNHFRDVTIPVSKLIVREEGKTLWKDDENGYEVSTSVKKEKTLVEDLPLLMSSKSF
jgi:hypothetical protein